MITQKLVKELFDYDPSLGDLIRKTGGKGKHCAGSVAGCVDRRGYLLVRVFGTLCKAHRVAWLIVHGYLPEGGIDHIDRNPANNRIDNLREVGQVCNLRNAKLSKANTSGVKGVHWSIKGKKWVSMIAIKGKQYSLGHFSSFTEAVANRLAAEQCLNWSGCDSSSPAYKYIQEYLETVRPHRLMEE